MKKWISFMLAIAMLMMFAGCSKQEVPEITEATQAMEDTPLLKTAQ